MRLRSLLTDKPPIPEKVGHTTGVCIPYSFRTVGWILLRPTRTYRIGLSAVRRDLQHFLLSNLKTLSVGPAGVEPAQQVGALPTELNRQRLTSLFKFCSSTYESSHRGHCRIYKINSKFESAEQCMQFLTLFSQYQRKLQSSNTVKFLGSKHVYESSICGKISTF